jgi:hypothetical protein
MDGDVKVHLLGLNIVDAPSVAKSSGQSRLVQDTQAGDPTY